MSNPRAAHRRVRSGCITCRKRRVKCDESKPICLRCQSFGVVCDGYLPTKKMEMPNSVRSFAINAKILIPHARSETQLPTLLFDTEQEQQYFAMFSEKLSAEIMPYFDSTPWRQMVLQACALEPATRHAATAIGALGKTFQAIQTGSGRRPQNAHHRAPTLGGPIETAQRLSSRVSRKEQVQEASSHHNYALQQYQMAIRHSRTLASGNNIRAILINLIILACFEVLHGNQDSAAAQLQSGIGLLQDWKNRQTYASNHPIGFSSPAPGTIEDYLVQVLGRLEIQAMSFLDSRPVERHLALKEEGKNAIHHMPKDLASINQARVYLDLIMRRMMHFTASTNHFKVSYAQYTKASLTTSFGTSPSHNLQTVGTPQQLIEQLPNGAVPWIDVKVVPGYSQEHFSALQAQSREQEALESEMAQWFTGFTPLLKYSIAKGGHESISALTLSLAATTSSISIRAAFIKAETEYDVFAAEFNNIVSQSDLLLQSLECLMPKTKVTLAFSFDLGVIPPLYLTAVKCRISEVRKKALQLLTKYPRREGVWDSVTTAALGTWLTELEEEGMTGDFVPEENRVRKGSISYNLVERKATMTCLQLEKELGDYVARRRDISW